MRIAGSERGCSLIEALVATSILAVGVASLAQLFTLAIGSNLVATRRTHGAMLASQKIEELRALAWEDAIHDGGADGVGEYRRRWSVNPLLENADHALVIDVVVTWNDAQVVHLSTIKSRRAE